MQRKEENFGEIGQNRAASFFLFCFLTRDFLSGRVQTYTQDKNGGGVTCARDCNSSGSVQGVSTTDNGGERPKDIYELHMQDGA